jgi:RNA polymerase sigma-70 factor (ECF subfamily)
VPTPERLAEQFEAHRRRLETVAYRMLGSISEAEDAVQEAWIRLSRADVTGVENLRGWLTTVVARVCLDMLRTRASRREEPMDVHVPDPVVRAIESGNGGPEADAMLADSLGLALLIVLEKLEPAERLAFVLHDVFGMTFAEIAPIVDRSTVATRQLASRARRRVQGQAPRSEGDLQQQRGVVQAFLAAVQNGDFEALVAVLDPDIVLRADGGPIKGMSRLVRGAEAVVAQAAAFSRVALSNQFVLVNDGAGLVSRLPDGRVFSVIGFTIARGRVVEMDILADPERLSRLDLPAIERSISEDQTVTQSASSNGPSASDLISNRIAELGDWRGRTLRRIRSLIKDADPQVVEEWKWAKATTPGTPVWSHDGIICTGESYKSIVKLTFARGASLKDPRRLFNSSLDGNVRRAIDIHEGDQLDESAFKTLVRQAVELNGMATSKRRRVKP